MTQPQAPAPRPFVVAGSAVLPDGFFPTLEELKAWLGVDAADTADDVVLQDSLDAACQAQALQVAYPIEAVTEEPVLTDDLVNAIFLRAQRLAARRNSPEGVVGFAGTGGDFVATRVPAYDNDVVRLEGPHYMVPVA